MLTAAAPAAAETIATFTRNASNPILRSLRIGGETAATSLGAQAVHYIPRSEAPPEQLALIDEVIRNKPDAIVLAPYDAKAMVAAVDRLNAAGIAVTNVNERLAGGKVVSYVGTDDYQLALATARTLVKAMGGKGNVVILEGPENLPASVARAKGYKDALKEFPEVKLVAAKSANYARAQAVDVMKDFLRSSSPIEGVLAANDAMAIGAIEQLKAANRKALVVGINAGKEALDAHQVGRPPRQRRLQRLSPGLPRRRDRGAQSAPAGGAERGDLEGEGGRQDQFAALRDADGAARLSEPGKRRDALRHALNTSSTIRPIMPALPEWRIVDRCRRLKGLTTYRHERASAPQHPGMDRLRALGGAEEDRSRTPSAMCACAARFPAIAGLIRPATATSRSRTTTPRSRR